MECSLETREDSGFRGKQYFSPELLPERLKVRAFRLNGEAISAVDMPSRMFSER